MHPNAKRNDLILHAGFIHHHFGPVNGAGVITFFFFIFFKMISKICLFLLPLNRYLLFFFFFSRLFECKIKMSMCDFKTENVCLCVCVCARVRMRS